MIKKSTFSVLAVIIATGVIFVLSNYVYSDTSSFSKSQTLPVPNVAKISPSTKSGMTLTKQQKSIETKRSHSHRDSKATPPVDNYAAVASSNKSSQQPKYRLEQSLEPPHLDASSDTLARYGYPNISMKKRPMIEKRQEIMKSIKQQDRRRHHIENYDFFINTTPR